MNEAAEKPPTDAGQRIDVHQEVEVREWAKALGVRPDELLQAVAVVGDGAARVQRYLKSEVT